MISKNSFSKLLFNEYKQKLWVFTLSSLVFFFSMLMPIIISVSIEYNPIGFYGKSNATMISDLILDFTTFMSLNNYFLGFVLIILGLISALASFHYLNHKRKIEFYHCLPVKREKWFIIHILVAMGNVLIPYMIISLLSAAFIFANTMHAAVFAIAFKAFVIHLPFFAVSFATAVLAILLTGKVLINIFAALTLYFYIPLCSVLLYLYKTAYLSTFYESAAFEVPFSSFIWIFHPYFENLAIDLSLAFVLSIFLLILSLILYKYRASERADNAMAFPILKTPIKCLIVILIGLWAALIMSSIKHTFGFGLFGICLGTVISHCIIEIIYHSDFKKLFANLWHLLVCGIICIFAFAAFFFDIFGYNSYVPKENALESIGIYTDALEANADFYRYEIIEDEEDGFIYKRTGKYDPNTDLVNHIKISNTELGIALAARLVEKNIQDVRSSSGDDANDTPSDIPIYVYVRYNLKSGQSKLREYQVYYDDIKDLLTNLYMTQEWKESIYPILIQEEDIVSFDYMHFSGGQHTLVSEAQAQKLWNAYRKDLYALTQETRENSQPFANIRFNTMQDERVLENMKNGAATLSNVEAYVNYYPIYDTFTETIKILEEDYGMNVTPKPLAQDVIRIEDTLGLLLVDGEQKDIIEKILNLSRISDLPYQSYVGNPYKYDDTTILVHTANHSIEMDIDDDSLEEILK